MIWKNQISSRGFNVPLRKINHIDEAENFKNQLNIHSLDYPEDFSPIEFEIKNAASVIKQYELAQNYAWKKVSAMVTGPINKSILEVGDLSFLAIQIIWSIFANVKKIRRVMMLNNYLKIIPLTIKATFEPSISKNKETVIKKNYLNNIRNKSTSSIPKWSFRI